MTIEEMTAELKTCIESLEPHAPGNGHKVDGFHAGAAALRVLAALGSLKDAIAQEREACAKIADRNDQSAWGIAQEIRKRGVP